MNINSVWVFHSEWRCPYDIGNTISIFKNKEDALTTLREEVQSLLNDFEADEYLEDFEVCDRRDNGYFELKSETRGMYATVSVNEYVVQ